MKQTEQDLPLTTAATQSVDDAATADLDTPATGGETSGSRVNEVRAVRQRAYGAVIAAYDDVDQAQGDDPRPALGKAELAATNASLVAPEPVREKVEDREPRIRQAHEAHPADQEVE